jgi:hypothetical protein
MKALSGTVKVLIRQRGPAMIEIFVGLAVLYLMKRLFPEKGTGTDPDCVIIPLIHQGHSGGVEMSEGDLYPDGDADFADEPADSDCDDEFMI